MWQKGFWEFLNFKHDCKFCSDITVRDWDYLILMFAWKVMEIICNHEVQTYMPRKVWLAAINTSDIIYILMFSVWRLKNHPQNLFIVSCASLNVNPSPNLTLTLNGRPWEEISHSASVQDASPNSYSSSSSKFCILIWSFYSIVD